LGAKADAEAAKQRQAQLALEAERDAEAAAALAALHKERAAVEAKAAIARAEAAAHEKLRAEQARRLAEEAKAAADRAEAYRWAQEGLTASMQKAARASISAESAATRRHGGLAGHTAAMARRRALNKEHLCAMGNYEQAKNSVGDYFGRGRPMLRERGARMYSRFERAELGATTPGANGQMLLKRDRPVIKTRGSLLLGQPQPRTMLTN
jgi:hypothetical protein